MKRQKPPQITPALLPLWDERCFVWTLPRAAAGVNGTSRALLPLSLPLLSLYSPLLRVGCWRSVPRRSCRKVRTGKQHQYQRLSLCTLAASSDSKDCFTTSFLPNSVQALLYDILPPKLQALLYDILSPKLQALLYDILPLRHPSS